MASDDKPEHCRVAPEPARAPRRGLHLKRQATGDFGMVSKRHCCGGTPELGRVSAENWWGEQPARVENVPAWVCRDCGEQYFDAATCRSLDELRSSPPKAGPFLEVPVYVFAG